jgi:hypothetical protein
MKATCYLRIASGPRGYKFAATAKPSAQPISAGVGDALITRQIRLDLDLPPDFFRSAQVAVEVPDGAGELIEVEVAEGVEA